VILAPAPAARERQRDVLADLQRSGVINDRPSRW
jgi:hypothetical protein